MTDIMNLATNVKMIDFESKFGISIENAEIKDFTIKYQIYTDSIEASAYFNERFAHIYTCEGFKNVKDIGRAVNELNRKMSERLFTDEELVSPCMTIEEYERRMCFITNTYIKKVIEVKVNETYDEEFDNNAIYDPVSRVYVRIEDEEFVKHHIWLYQKIKCSIKQSIFPMDIENLGKERKFMTCCTCLKYAEDDDPYLHYAKEYLKNNARSFAKTCYKGKGSNAIPIWLVKEGYIKAPTMKILLDMANQYGDSQFAAVILDVMKSKKKKKSEFKL